MNKFEAVRIAVAERDKFLLEHPELQPLQDEITRVLALAGNAHNRQAALQKMMLDKWHEILPLFGVRR